MRFSLLLGAAVGLAIPAAAQTATPAPAAPPIAISGLAFGGFTIRTDSAARASAGGKQPTAFSVDRIYVNIKAPIGDNGALRFTSDIFQNTDSTRNGYYQGPVIRMKYLWFEYTMARDVIGKGSSLLARVGSINNVVIDPATGAWPRFFSPIAVERVPYFSSADIGVGALLTLPNKLGDVYATITNGPGYTSYDKDRFKDPAVRLMLTPLANRGGYLQTFYVMPWFYKGYVGSRFAAGGAGQVGPGDNGAVTEALVRDRYGVLTGVRDRRLTVVAELAYQHDARETGLNTAASPRVVSDSVGRMMAAYAVARPFELLNAGKASPLLVIVRYDHLTPNVDPAAPEYAGTTPSYDYTTLGVAYELNQRLTLAVDWQADRAVGFPAPTGTNVRPRAGFSAFFLHWNVTF